jgi:hypothetical protein
MKTTIIIILTITIFLSCKKKDNTTPTNNPSQTSTTGAANTTGVMGNLQSGYNVLDIGNGQYVFDSSIVASFYDMPSGSSLPNNIYVGVVKVNNNIMKYETSLGFYQDTTIYLNMNNLIWNVAGSGTVTAFSHTHTPVYPKYASSNIALLDTCLKANGFTVNVNGITNTNANTTIYVFQGANSAFKYITGSSGNVTFSPTDLAAFTTNSSLSIYVYLTNYHTVPLGSVSYAFSDTYSYTKFSYLK